MNAYNFLQDHWESLLKMLPEGFDLDTTLRESGAWKRRRAIDTAQTLLRLALIWSLGGLSLRATAAWAQARQLARLSDVALLKRLRKATAWFGQILGATLAQRAGALGVEPCHYRLCMVDATTVSRPGSQGADYRLHLAWDPGLLSIRSLEVTGPEKGESLTRFKLRPGDLVLADRGYAHRRGLSWVRQAGADFLVRINWQNLPLQDSQQQRLDLAALLSRMEGTEVVELEVWTVAQPKQKIEALPARLLVVPRAESEAQRDRQRIHREASHKGYKADPRSLLAARFFLLLTSVPASDLPASQALELYRFRWQIEMTFKRMKGLFDLGHVPAKDPQLAQSYLLTKLLAILLLENLTEDFLAFSPSEGEGYEKAVKSVANPADPAWRPRVRGSRQSDSVGTPGQGFGVGASPL